MHVRSVTVAGRKVIQLVLVPDEGHGSTASMHHFCELLRGPEGAAVLRAFAATLPRDTGELDVLRMFFYSPDTKSSAQQYEETAAILAAAFATCDCVPHPVADVDVDDDVDGRDMSVYVASIDRGAVAALRRALDATDYDVEIELTRGARLRVTLRGTERADSDLCSVGSTLSRFGTGTVDYDERAMEGLVPLLVLAAQHDTRTWRRFVCAVHAADSEVRFGIDEPVMKMLIALALRDHPVPAAPAGSPCARHRTFITALRAPPPGSPFSPVSRVDDEADESRLALAAYKLNTHFERVMRHRPVASHIKVTRARASRRLRVRIPEYVPPYATTDPGHYYGPYTVYIDPGDLVVPCDGLFE
jgi:hypothetical protein